MKRVQSKDIPGFTFPIPDVTGWPKKGVLLELGTLLGQSAVIWAETIEANDIDKRINTISVDVERQYRYVDPSAYNSPKNQMSDELVTPSG